MCHSKRLPWFLIIFVFFLLLKTNLAFGICDDLVGVQKNSNGNSPLQQVATCTRAKNGYRRGNLTKEPVLLQNGNLQLTSQDIDIPGRGLSLNLTRIYNAQISSDVDGFGPEDGSGSWVIENMEYSGNGGESFSKYSYDDAVIEASLKTITPGVFDNEVGTLYFRYQGFSYYYFLIHANGDLELSKIQNGWFYPLVNQPSSYNPLEWNNVRIVTTGSLIEISINGNPEISYTDATNPVLSGRVALVSYNSHAHF